MQLLKEVFLSDYFLSWLRFFKHPIRFSKEVANSNWSKKVKPLTFFLMSISVMAMIEMFSGDTLNDPSWYSALVELEQEQTEEFFDFFYPPNANNFEDYLSVLEKSGFIKMSEISQAEGNNIKNDFSYFYCHSIPSHKWRLGIKGDCTQRFDKWINTLKNKEENISGSSRASYWIKSIVKSISAKDVGEYMQKNGQIKIGKEIQLKGLQLKDSESKMVQFFVDLFSLLFIIFIYFHITHFLLKPHNKSISDTRNVLLYLTGLFSPLMGILYIFKSYTANIDVSFLHAISSHYGFKVHTLSSLLNIVFCSVAIIFHAFILEETHNVSFAKAFWALILPAFGTFFLISLIPVI